VLVNVTLDEPGSEVTSFFALLFSGQLTTNIFYK
jgi:hypothetical protein